MKKNEGKRFEEDFYKSIKEEVFCYRLRDSASGWGNTDSKVRFTCTNICDFIAFNKITNKIVLLELKSTLGKSISFNNFKMTQIEGMDAYKHFNHCEAYYLINFRDLEKTYMIEADTIRKIYNNEIANKNKSSIPVDLIAEYGTLIEYEKKRVRYKYLFKNILF